jgi:hypothetical protein
MSPQQPQVCGIDEDIDQLRRRPVAGSALRGPVHLDHSAVAIGDDHSRSELIERSQRSGRSPTQVAKLGMQSGSVAQGLEKLLKAGSARPAKKGRGSGSGPSHLRHRDAAT